MRPRKIYHLPEDKQKKLKQTMVLEWTTIFFLLTITVVIYLTMGSSQAMKAAWIEDVLSLIPPICFLIAMRFRDREPTPQFPYGYRRAALLAFMVAAVAVLVLGLYMLYDSTMAFLKREHPTIGHFTLFGTNWQIWSGWVMIAALIYSMIPPYILGRMKLSMAEDLHEKTLHADAAMNKADWMTAGAAILGIIGIGSGLWWADAAAAGLISIDVVKDGVTNTKGAICDLMDRQPTTVSRGEPLDLPDRIRDELQQLDDVVDVDVRLREEGSVISGVLFVVLTEQENIPQRLQQLSDYATELDWRLYDLVVVPVDKMY